MKRILLSLILVSSWSHAEVLNCASKTSAQFVSDLGIQEIKFKEEAAKRDFEELHRLVGEDPLFEISLLLWPAHAENALPYTETFEECAAVANDYIKSIPGKSQNTRQYNRWQECLQLLYKDNRSAAALELDSCFKKFHRK